MAGGCFLDLDSPPLYAVKLQTEVRPGRMNRKGKGKGEW